MHRTFLLKISGINTLNIRRDGPEQKRRKKVDSPRSLIEQLLQSKKPDIFGLQEVTQNQWADLNNMLPDYESFGKGRGTSWFGWGPDEATPLFL